MQNEIEEIAKTIFDYVGSKGEKHVYVLGNDTAKEMREYSHNQGIAEVLYNAGYRKTFTSEFASDTQKAFKEGYAKAITEYSEKELSIYNNGYDRGVEDAVQDFARKLKKRLFDLGNIVSECDIDELLAEVFTAEREVKAMCDLIISNPPFSSVYVCKGMLPKTIIFEKINK